MARPRKCRRICGLPGQKSFGPVENAPLPKEIVEMQVDEYETVRLIDLEGLTQEECAQRMEVARTTVQSIYGSARKKLAEALVNGKILHIAGGDYQVCDGTGSGCGKKRGCRRRQGQMPCAAEQEIKE